MPKPSITLKKPLQAFENTREMKKTQAADKCFTLRTFAPIATAHL